jgi:bifunctional UDP-N-acetylglucosamine pyrophosphorylase/glucosamine-1-phosphate N-acetyltransferase
MIPHICRQISKYLPEFPLLDTPWDLMRVFSERMEGKINLPKRKVDGLELAEVYADDDVVIQPYVLFTGKVILCKGCRIGPFSFIRGPAFIGPDAMIGPHSEVMRCIIMDRTVLAHKNLVGDTIFGEDIFYAGMCTGCNIPYGPMATDYVKIRHKENTHLHKGKFGATIGNRVKMGCLTITMPGCFIPDDTTITGQCIVHGNCQIKPFIQSGVNHESVISGCALR